MSADLYFTKDSSSFFFFLLLFVSYCPGSLNGTEPKPVTCSEVSAIWKCMSQIWGIPFPYKSGAQNHLFVGFRNLTTTLTADILGTKHGTCIHKRVSALQTTRGLLHRLKMTWTLGHKQVQLGSEFSPTLCKFYIYFIARLRRRRSGNGT